MNNVTPAVVYFGRDKAILQQRERVKQKTFEARRLHHRQRAAYEAGWLSALEKTAIAEQADAVAPLIFIGPSTPKRIHHAGGSLFAEKSTSSVTLKEKHRLMNQDWPEVKDCIDELAYNITARRIISGLVLKYLNGSRLVMLAGYETNLPFSTVFL